MRAAKGPFRLSEDDPPSDVDRWDLVKIALEQARINYNDGLSEMALGNTIAALGNLYALLKPPSAKELE